MSNARRFSAADWTKCENAARSAAIAGGITCMGYFGGALAQTQPIDDRVNASTTADVHATAAVLLSLNTTIPQIAAELDVGYSVFAEELDGDWNDALTRVAEQMGVGHVKRSSKDFVRAFDHTIGVLFDALDGTTNFRAGLPLFCSAVSVFVDGTPRVGAIYDPTQNTVYFGSLHTGPTPPLVSRCSSWAVSIGKSEDLARKVLTSPTGLIASHLTRSKPAKREEMIEHLRALSEQSQATFMINSGQLALALVASGQFSAYVNNYTNIWDIAAGEVLVRAIGGQVTDFVGNPIQYGESHKVAVVASRDERLHRDILDILKGSASRTNVTQAR
jgi:fructose-1,6-bisphosphatase/inositol monophosphatase family enzyme